jgi:hypothetical protein
MHAGVEPAGEMPMIQRVLSITLILLIPLKTGIRFLDITLSGDGTHRFVL